MKLKALLIGINLYPMYPLRGCVNDVHAMREWLEERYHPGKDALQLLLDADATRAAILDELRWLDEPEPGGMQRANLLYFAGHGTILADPDGTEPDGRLLALAPYDYASSGLIRRDALCNPPQSPPKGSHRLAITDCGYSGTISRSLDYDLVFRFIPTSYEEQLRVDAAAQRYSEDMQKYAFEELTALRHRELSDDELRQSIEKLVKRFNQQRRPPPLKDVVSISAAREQSVGEKPFADCGHRGIFTYCLLRILRETGGRIEYRGLIDRVSRLLYDETFSQNPQLVCAPSAGKSLFLGGLT